MAHDSVHDWNGTMSKRIIAYFCRHNSTKAMYKTRTACQTALNQIKKAFARLYVCNGPTTLTEDVVRAMLGFDHEDPFFQKDIPGINFPQGLQPKDKADLLQIAFARNVLKKLSTSILDSKIIEEINRETIVSFMELNEMLINVGFNISKYLDEWTLEMGRRSTASACISSFAANATQPCAQPSAQPCAQPTVVNAAPLRFSPQPSAQIFPQPGKQRPKNIYDEHGKVIGVAFPKSAVSPFGSRTAAQLHIPPPSTSNPVAQPAACMSSGSTANTVQPCAQPAAPACMSSLAANCEQPCEQPLVWTMCSHPKVASRVPCVATYCPQSLYQYAWKQSSFAKKPFINGWSGKPKTPKQRYPCHTIDKDGVQLLHPSLKERLSMEASSAWFLDNSTTDEAETVTILNPSTDEPLQIVVFRDYPDGFRVKDDPDYVSPFGSSKREAREFMERCRREEAMEQREMNKCQRISSAPSTPREQPPIPQTREEARNMYKTNHIEPIPSHSTLRLAPRFEAELQTCEQTPRKEKPDCIPAPKMKNVFGAKSNSFKVNHVQFNH